MDYDTAVYVIVGLVLWGMDVTVLSHITTLMLKDRFPEQHKEALKRDHIANGIKWMPLYLIGWPAMLVLCAGGIWMISSKPKDS